MPSPTLAFTSAARLAPRAPFAGRALHPAAQRRTAPRVFAAAARTARPTLDDVDRLSRGQAAKRRGTGSRAVPHHLHLDERKNFDLLKTRGYLETTTTAPLSGPAAAAGAATPPVGALPNIARQWCDAKGQPFIHIVKGPRYDQVWVDFSPLRAPVGEAALRRLAELAARVDGRAMTALELQVEGGAEWESFSPAWRKDPIWRIPAASVRLVFESANRSAVKEFGKALASGVLVE